MPDFSLHLAPFLEILAAIVATPAVGFYAWLGLRRRKRARLASGEVRQPPKLR